MTSSINKMQNTKVNVLLYSHQRIVSRNVINTYDIPFFAYNYVILVYMFICKINFVIFFSK